MISSSVLWRVHGSTPYWFTSLRNSSKNKV
jgi:hypothetical protein